MFDYTIPFDKDFMAFVTPNPQPLPKWMALISPFSPFVWLLIAISVVAFGFVFWFVANFESKIQEYYYKSWAVLNDALWYTFGAFVGEDVTEDNDSVRAPAIRQAKNVLTSLSAFNALSLMHPGS